MWRTALFCATVLLSAGTARAQRESPPPPRAIPELPGSSGSLPFPVVAPGAPFVNPPGGGAFAGPQAPPESAAAFDSDQAELQWRDNRWQLWAGNVFLKDFGRFETEGREALRLVRELRLNSQGTIGSPRPIMEYWLTNGEAPRAPAHGLRTLPIDPATLRAEQVQGQWTLRDEHRILFNFGAQSDAARQALAVVQRYGFTQVGYVGQVSPMMLVFLAAPPTLAQVQAQAQTPNRMRETRLPRLGSLVAPRTPSNAGANGAAPQAPAQMPPLTAPTLPQGNIRQPGPITPVGMMGLNHPSMPGAPVPGFGAADRVPFNARDLQVRRDNGDWKLASGNTVLASFGPSEADARLAQAALRYYHCTELVTVGGPQPVLSYYLTNGQAPRGSMLGLNGVSFRPESLALRQFGPSVVLWDGTQVVMSFGDRGVEAQQALQAIQQHHFDRMVRIGNADRAMTLLVRAN